jgi:hypothetical protein
MIMALQTFIAARVLVALTMPMFAQPRKEPARPDVAKGDFFIVSSIDLAKKQILLKTSH